LAGFLALALLNNGDREIASQTTENAIIQGNSILARNVVETPKRAMSLASLLEFSTDEILSCLIVCESGGDETKINPDDMGSPSLGLLQFKLPTFERYCKGDIMSGKDQIKCAKEMIDNGGIGHWRNCAEKCNMI